MKELRSVLSMVIFVRRFIKDCADVAAPLVDLNRKEFITKPGPESDQDHASAHMKRVLTSAPALKCRDIPRELFVHCNASNLGTGSFIGQQSKNGTNPDGIDIIAYFPKRFSKYRFTTVPR